MLNYWTFTIYGSGFSWFVFSAPFRVPKKEPIRGYAIVIMSSHNTNSIIGLGCSRFARRYYENRVCFLFLQLLRCFNSPGYLFPTYEFRRKFIRLPHSGIFGSKLVASSPKRIAGTCALRRLWVPRSPPWAFVYLTMNFVIDEKSIWFSIWFSIKELYDWFDVQSMIDFFYGFLTFFEKKT